MSASSIRIDKWLWAARIYKTRAQATNACRLGKVRVAGQTAKPARSLSLHEIVTVAKGGLTRTLRVLELVEKRAGALRIPEILEDLTPPEEHERARAVRTERRLNSVVEPGAGRPTKRDRRVMGDFLDQVSRENERERN